MKTNELAWVAFLKQSVAKGPGVIKGIGDDCALVSLGKEKFLLKSDLFVEGVHYRTGDTSYKTIGMRAVARVLSDFAACGGIPRFIGISIGAPAYIKEHSLKEILAGVLALAKEYKFSLIGGDTGRAPKLVLDVWGVGQADRFISRTGAKVGDLIFVTGKLGARSFNKPFAPRIREACYLVRNFTVNAMIDISDGFAIDLYRILKESNKGALLNQDALPLTNGIGDLYRGEDYELIFTVDKSEHRAAALAKKFYCVGRVMPQVSGYMIEHRNMRRPVPVKGYTHF